MITTISQCVCVNDFREFAKNHLPKNQFLYYDSAAQQQQTSRENCSYFKKIMLIPRILINTTSVDMNVMILGRQCSLPFGFSPCAMNQFAHQEGQTIPAKIAYQKKICYCLSMLSSCSLQEICTVNINGLKLLQLYITKDWKITKKCLKLAEKYNFDGIVITVDAQVKGLRKYEQINFQQKNEQRLKLPILKELNFKQSRQQFLKERNLCLNWQMIAKIRGETKLKLILKGILHYYDAEKAQQYCDGIWISNHGGRQLGNVPSTIQLLEQIYKKISSLSVQLYIDGCIRNGSDIYKCLAFGANYCFIGRPVLYSLVGGQNGVNKLVHILQNQLKRTMILMGITQIKQINKKYVTTHL